MTSSSTTGSTQPGGGSRTAPANSGVNTATTVIGTNSRSSTVGSSKGQTSYSSSSSTPQSMSLAHRFPVNSLLELTLQTSEKISGRIYCTDEVTRSIVIQTALVHTTLVAEIRIISADSIVTSVPIVDSSTTTPTTNNNSNIIAIPLMQPLPKIHKKALEEKERRAMKLAEESIRHINENASAIGQAVFDRLLKACGEVVWAPGDSASIIVLNQIQVDAPYNQENCKSITRPGSGNGVNGRSKQGGLEDGSLERVKKIVEAAMAATTTK